MVQHVQIVLNEDVPPNPVAESTLNNIWRDDQQICWFFTPEVIAAGWGWDNSREEGPNKAVEFAGDSGWDGSAPVPVGLMPVNPPDLRHYCATGPGANAGPDVPTYHYTLYFVNGTKKFSHDPEVGNQPQP